LPVANRRQLSMINPLPKLNVHYLPQFVSESKLADSVVVVVDLLRASTTICHALASGAKCVVPCLEIDETWAQARKFSRDEIVLGGERDCTRIEGFDLGRLHGRPGFWAHGSADHYQRHQSPGPRSAS